MKQFEHNILLGLGTNFFSSLPAAMPVIILTVILVSNGFSIKLFNVCNLLSLRNNSLSTHIFLSHSKLDYIISMVTSSNRPECWEEKELSGCLAEASETLRSPPAGTASASWPLSVVSTE